MDRHINTHTETKSKYFDGHSHLSQSEESECMLAHEKDGITRVFERCHQGLREEWMEGNLKGDYLRLMPALCLEDRMCHQGVARGMDGGKFKRRLSEVNASAVCRGEI